MDLLKVSALVLLAGSSCFAAPGRIIGGAETTIENYPSLVQVDAVLPLFGAWSQSCSGIILNNFYILSAAHCFDGPSYNPSQRRIRAGSTYRNSGGAISYVEKAINHESYGLLGSDGDISIVRLSQSLLYSEVIQQARILASGGRIPDNSLVTHAGWGAYRVGGDSSDQLRDVQIRTINNDVCRQRYSALGNSSLVTSNMVCAGLLDIDGSGGCQSDAGGPLYYDDIVFGIFSWNAGCNNATYPSVFTAVSSYTNWILLVAI